MPEINRQSSREAVSAVILASGKGSRLGGIVESTPKPLLEFAGKPYLQYLIDWLLGNCVNDIVVTTHVHADEINTFVASRQEYDKKVATVREPELISTAESAKAGLARARKAASLILTADNIWDVNLGKMQADHYEHASKATVMLTARRDVPNAGKVQVGENDTVLEMWPQPETQRVLPDKTLRAGSTMGLYLVDTTVMLESIEPGDSSIERESMGRMIPEVRAYWNDGFFFDFGTPDNYRWLCQHTDVINQYLQQ